MATAAPSANRPELTGLAIALAAHAGLLWYLSQGSEETPDPPSAMEVSFVEEVGPVSTAPEMSEAPAPALGEELAPAEQASGSPASVAEPVIAPVPEPVRPPVETGERRRPDLTRNPVQLRPVPPPRVAQNQPQQRRATPTPQRAQPQPRRPQASPGQGQAQRNSGFDANRLAQLIGRGQPEARGASPAPRAAATSQQRTSFTSALASKIARCSRQQRPSTQEARTLRPVVVIRLREDGSLDGAPVVRSVEGLNETNRQYEMQAREAIVRAVRNCAPYTGLPPELYNVPNGWRQPPPIRLNFQ